MDGTITNQLFVSTSGTSCSQCCNLNGSGDWTAHQIFR